MRRGRHRKPSRFAFGARLNAATAIALVVVLAIAGGVGVLLTNTGRHHGAATSVAVNGGSAVVPPSAPSSAPASDSPPASASAVSDPPPVPSSAARPSVDPNPAPVDATPLPVGAAMRLGGDSGVAITPAEAKQLVASFWPVYATAASRPVDTKTLAPLEEGVAATADPNYCGCIPFSPDVDDVWVAVPRQDAYPATFAALVTSGGDDSSRASVLGFRRDSAASPWRLESHVLLGAGSDLDDQWFGPLVDSDGFAATLTTSDRQAVADLPSALVGAWSSAKASGNMTVPTRLSLDGPWTEARMQQLAAGGRQDGMQSNGEYAHFAFTASSPTIEFVAGYRQDVLACDTITETTTWTPPQGELITQFPNTLSTHVGLAPGTYSKVVDTLPWQVCFLSANADDDATVFGQNAEEYASSVGTPTGAAA